MAVVAPRVRRDLLPGEVGQACGRALDGKIKALVTLQRVITCLWFEVESSRFLK